MTCTTHGSSPLTRGKLTKARAIEFSVGLIPAHAGKTRGPSIRYRISPAHPRSRGENRRSARSLQAALGSSPLTRGKRWPRGWPAGRTRLIPAHAGKTGADHCDCLILEAHPRSRGENVPCLRSACERRGSSPLTRGKREYCRDLAFTGGLIPAHAGKTCGTTPLPRSRRAHPRSRGENVMGSLLVMGGSGSSPLTRGKHTMTTYRRKGFRLIPAHAGKTRHGPPTAPPQTAHPRSRGENGSDQVGSQPPGGSSPLTRGKRVLDVCEEALRGLIPAHAGKTRRRSVSISPRAAHPRSRGENTNQWGVLASDAGSSPLTRGKLQRPQKAGIRQRLIPAHAGKTSTAHARIAACAAHPRSRGENTALR